MAAFGALRAASGYKFRLSSLLRPVSDVHTLKRARLPENVSAVYRNFGNLFKNPVCMERMRWIQKISTCWIRYCYDSIAFPRIRLLLVYQKRYDRPCSQRGTDQVGAKQKAYLDLENVRVNGVLE